MPHVGYYADRAARDPDWRRAQVAAAVERKRRARERDPEALRAAERAACHRYREKQREVGLTFRQLLDRSRETAGRTSQSIGDPEVLAWVLRDELRRGRIEYHAATRRYALNGGLLEDVKAALLSL
jgi:hypothetical protein